MDHLVRQHFAAMQTGDPGIAAECIHPAHVNHMAADEPAACAELGVPGFLATSAWLRFAFADLRWEVIETASEGDRAIAHVLMRGRQTGPFVVFPVGAKPVAFPPTGREFAVRQCHVFRLLDGRHAEHTAVRDDLGLMTQLGHLPPKPATIARMIQWRAGGGAKRAVAAATAVAAAGARGADRP